MTLIDLLPLAWPVVTGLASFALHVLERRYPQIAAFLRATGLDLPAALRAMRPASPPEAKPSDAPEDPPSS